MSSVTSESLKKSHSHVSIYQKDEETQPKLKLFESPLAHDRRKYSITPSLPNLIQNISGPINIARKQIHESTIKNQYDERKIESFSQDDAEDEMMETPEFRRYEETTNMELFYDLFFVANLTTFNDVHDINEMAALKSYAGFFCILWFLWLQVGLFDVRFVSDSILERLGKAFQFGVMMGLAIVGPDFNSSDQNPGAFRSLAIILMFSRLVLCFQYSVILYHVCGFTKETSKTGKVFIVWYITAILETAVNITISSKWKVLSFRGSHLVQRMTLLTLIILGEGIMGVSKSIADIAEQEESWTIPLILTVISAVGIIVVEVINQVSAQYTTQLQHFPASTSLDLQTQLTNITTQVFLKFRPKFTQTYANTQMALMNIGNTTFKSMEQVGNVTTLFSTVQDSLFDNFGIDPPLGDEMEGMGEGFGVDPNEEWTENLGFTYFFLSSGLSLILMNILNLLSRPHPSRADKIRIAINFFLSITLTLVALAGFSNTEMGFVFAQSAGVLPTSGDNILICDCGGGTVDITIYTVTLVVPKLKFEELCVGTGKCIYSPGNLFCDKPEEIISRLRNIYRTAADFSYYLWTRRMFLKVTTLKDLKKAFDNTEKTMIHHSIDKFHKGEFVGQPITLVLHPLIQDWGTEETKDYKTRMRILRPAQV
ncbi:hypothetical protein NHQ30_011418 [Ciborinia camelliae]|nr:hypothetical protein NHQ30_011418 [Ciborinia camelliae]